MGFFVLCDWIHLASLLLCKLSISFVYRQTDLVFAVFLLPYSEKKKRDIYPGLTNVFQDTYNVYFQPQIDLTEVRVSVEFPSKRPQHKTSNQI